MRTAQQQAGRPLRGRGNTAEGVFARPCDGVWDMGEYLMDCHGNSWSAVRLINILPPWEP